MDVAIIVHRLSSHRGGAEGWTCQWIGWLRQRGHRVHLVSSVAAPNEVSSLLSGQTLYPIRDRFDFAAAVAQRFDRNQVDLVHDMGVGYACDLFHPHSGSQMAMDHAREANLGVAGKIAFRLRQRLGSRQRKLQALAERQYQQPGTRFLAVSKKVANDLIELHHVSPDRVDTVYNGVDTQRLNPIRCQPLRRAAREGLKATPQEMVLLTISHNHRLKGVPLLIKLAGQTSLSNLHVVIVGGHRQRPGYRRLGNNRITWTGPVDEVLPYYAAADLFVLPTLYDACSLTVFEAMACGVPVITTRQNGASDRVTEGHSGYVIESPDDLPTLTRHVETMRCERRRLEMGHHARAAATNNTSEDNFLAIESIYHKLVHGRINA